MKLEGQPTRQGSKTKPSEVLWTPDSRTVFDFEAERDVPGEVKELWKRAVQDRSGDQGTGTHISSAFFYAVALPRRKEDVLLSDLGRKMQGKDFTQWASAAFIPYLFPDRLEELKTKLGDPKRLMDRQATAVLGSRTDIRKALLFRQVFPEALSQYPHFLDDAFVEVQNLLEALRHRGAWGKFTETAAYGRLTFPERFAELHVSSSDWESSLIEGGSAWATALQPAAKHSGLTNAFGLTVLSAGDVRLSPGSAVEISPERIKQIQPQPLPERTVL